ncbi:MAG: aldehyde dehydrogenase family protein, partial [Candidatus Marinimicrobia bacterium]|nr:aldehyde dehydrogenase family protein [Candidatus Neomarinimicrobiota bacterium]
MNEIQSRIKTVFNQQLANSQNIRNTTFKERSAKLKSIETWLMDHKEDIRNAMHQDYRKPASEVDITELWAALNEIRHIRRYLKKWMQSKKVKSTLTMATAEAWIQYEPKGVVLIITPWNFPFNLTISPLIAAIAAGNCAIIKPSELTPNSSKVIAKMVNDLFKEEEVALFEGDSNVAEALLDEPFNHIFFTGSPKIGSSVMEKAAKHLSTITLELGGKSPTIVDETANLKDAAQKISWGKFLNCGQICLAPDYVFVQKSVKEKLLEEIKTMSNKQFAAGNGSVMDSDNYARIVNNKHFERLSNLLNKTTDFGDKIYMGGNTDEETSFIEPTVLTDVTPDSPVMSEEIFGPILPIITFDNIDEVVKVINNKPKPLGLYIFSYNRKNIDFILKNTSAGGTSIN